MKNDPLTPEDRREIDEAQSRMAGELNMQWKTYLECFHDEFDGKGFTEQQGFVAWQLLQLMGHSAPEDPPYDDDVSEGILG